MILPTAREIYTGSQVTIQLPKRQGSTRKELGALYILQSSIMSESVFGTAYAVFPNP